MASETKLIAELEKSRQMLENVTQGITESILLLSKEFRVLWANKTAIEERGCKPEEIIGNYCYKITHLRESPCEPPFDLCPVAEFQKTGIPTTVEHIHFGRQGNKLYVEVSAYPVRNEQGEVVQFVHMCRDITERKQTGERLKESEARFRALAESANDAIIAIDMEGMIEFWNPAAEKMFGYSTDEIIGKPLTLIMPERFRSAYESGMQRVDTTGESRLTGKMMDTYGLRKDGSEFPVELSFASWKQEEKLFFAAICRDVTERKQMEDTLRSLSLIDELTGLYNRRGFFALAGQQLRIAIREDQGMLLIFIDLDNLKWINDTHGHQEGDKALIGIASVLKGTFRESDILSRIGGDEFVVLTRKDPATGAYALIDRLKKNLDTFNGEKIFSYVLSCSMGIAHYNPRNPSSLDTLLDQADASMYEQKRKKVES